MKNCMGGTCWEWGYVFIRNTWLAEGHVISITYDYLEKKTFIA